MLYWAFVKDKSFIISKASIALNIFAVYRSHSDSR